QYRWLEVCLPGSPLPPADELEGFLRPGVTLAHLGQSFDRTETTAKAKIFDPDMDLFLQEGLKFQHTDNINLWFDAMINVGFPKVFMPDTNDIYEAKNLPKLIYCLHALSFYLEKTGLTPSIIPLTANSISFTDQQKDQMHKVLADISMPEFAKANTAVEEELLASTMKKMEKRKQIENEILTTEKTYFDGLKRLHENFEKPMREADAKRNTMIPTAASDKIFSNTKMIRSTSEAILPKMEQGQTTEAILFLYPFIRDLYTDYAVAYRESAAEIEKQKAVREGFDAFLKRQPETLESLLLTPVQRVPRYLLLLVNLLSSYDEQDPDYASLKKAVKVISSVADEMNEKIREYENFQAIEDVRVRLWGTGTPALHTPGRVLIRVGDLNKQLHKDPTQKHPRRLFLFNDILIYAVAFDDKNYTASATKGVMDAASVVAEKTHKYVPKGLRDFGRKIKESAGEVLYNPNPNLTTYVFKSSVRLDKLELSDTDHQFFKLSHEGKDYRFESVDNHAAWIADLDVAIRAAKKKH
ncbi:hypothetical protein SARC_02975, partial [Sphaeroforma arctica JP610]